MNKEELKEMIDVLHIFDIRHLRIEYDTYKSIKVIEYNEIEKENNK